MFGVEQVGSSLMNIHDFELQDFIFDDANRNHFDHQQVNLIRGAYETNPIINFDLDLDLMNSCLVENRFGPNYADYMTTIADSNNGIMHNNSNPNSMFSTLESFNSGVKGLVDDDEDDDEDDQTSIMENSSVMKSMMKKQNVDRSRTLVSERRRRGKMKEKLYALRSLVPNITKMDKASIVGDAVLYVKELQMEAKKLKAEISVLESAINGGVEGSRGISSSSKTQKKIIQISRAKQTQQPKKIIQMDVFQVEERGFYLRLICKMGEGIAMALYKVVESITSFCIQTSNLASASDNILFTATVNVRDCGKDHMNLPNMKLWLTGALLNHGFEF